MLNNDCCMTAPTRGNVYMVGSPKEEETVDYSRPTKDEYEKAKANMKDMLRFIGMSRKIQDELLDKLCDERITEKQYVDCYERHREVVRRYEIYEEIEAKG